LNTSSIGKFEGRLFSEAGRLCLVVEANETTGMGRISYRADGEGQLALADLSPEGLDVRAQFPIIRCQVFHE